MPELSTTAGRIFISYRRDDSAYPAGWLFDRLVESLGPGNVFKDVDSIRPGDNFVSKITDAVGSCGTLLAVIGDRWLTASDEDGQRRLDNPSDFVRLEIGAALARSILVIPVLVNGARMPRPGQLPDSLKELASRQAVELSPGQFSSDVNRLIRSVTSPREQTLSGPAIHSDNGGFSHYALKSEMSQAISDRKPVQALCGWKWIPQLSRDAGDDLSRFPPCPRCKDIYDSLPSGR
jgi:TIR domain/Protein of unknown function (DUF3039)